MQGSICDSGEVDIMVERRNYEESYQFLQERGFIDEPNLPPVPERMPRYDDTEPLGISFLRTGVWDDDLSNLTLQRIFICRSEVSQIAFRNTDLFESRLCWNDFVDVDFTEANLAHCDLRQSRFQDVRFIGADLSFADMRQSEFIGCDFTGATMVGTNLTRTQSAQLRLAPEQSQAVDWQASDGDVPGGG
jgi:uncharacterized protein YjbI with pentapeptide repeats